MHPRTAGKTLVTAFMCFLAADAAAQGRAAVIEHELVLKPITIEGKTFQSRQCQAEVSLTYAQKNTLASVDGEIENPTCGASSGSLVLSVRTLSEGGEQATQEFTQTWMREDDQTVTFSAEYPIGENVDLVRVRALRVTCTCAEVPPTDGAAALPE
jgi:Flp pilus assembly protein CpaB